jgi:hypothetical protein
MNDEMKMANGLKTILSAWRRRLGLLMTMSLMNELHCKNVA